MGVAFPLQSLLDHARHRMQAAERLLMMIKRKEEAAKLKQQELERYREEYRARLADVSQAGMDILMLKDYRRFLDKLEQAIGQQAGEAEALHGRWLAAQESWLEMRKKVKSYEVLEVRHRQDETQRQDRREQRQVDELSNRKAAVSRLRDS
jgi:flagellar FliJ protein